VQRYIFLGKNRIFAYIKVFLSRRLCFSIAEKKAETMPKVYFPHKNKKNGPKFAIIAIFA